ncbi:MAG TPA: AtpZ/AtpI family protein [Flavobacteriaceae bacterium]|nr:AtpZ/AtpI family protein [Flavobacteriaceae bacterium]
MEFTQIGLQMGVVITAGVLLGLWLDEKFPNKYKAFTIILSLFSVFASLYMVIKKALRMSKQEENSEDA